MLPPAELKSALEASRTFEVSLAGGTFYVRLPSEHQLRVTLEKHMDAHSNLLQSAGWRAVLDVAVTGFTGINARDVLGPEAPDELLEFSPETRALVLDHRQQIADQLAAAIAAELVKRRAAREAARKN